MKKRPTTAFSLGNAKNVRFENVTISGFDVGIAAEQGASFSSRGLHFDRVGIPFDIAGGRASVSGTRITRDPKIHAGAGKSRVGWRRPHGPPLPAFCPKCKSVFPSKNYNFGSSYFWSRGNEEVCPECGYEHAKLSDGLFDLSRELAEIITAPDISHAMLAAINSVANRTLSGELPESEVVEAFASVNKPLGNLLAKAIKFGVSAVLFIAALAAIGSYLEDRENTRIQQERLDLERDQATKTEEFLESVLTVLSELQEQTEEREDKADSSARCAPAQDEPRGEARVGEVRNNATNE